MKKNSSKSIVSVVSNTTVSADIQTKEVSMNNQFDNNINVPTMNLNVNGHPISFIGGPVALWAVRVGNFKETGRVLHFSDYGMVSAVLNAFTAMYHLADQPGGYPVNEPGLHLKFTYEDLKDLGSVEDAGYQKDADGNWHTVRFHAGQLIMGRMLVWTKGFKEEEEYVRQERKTVNKMIAMDLLTRGEKIELRPIFQNDHDANGDGIKGTSAIHVGQYLLAHAGTLQLSSADAAMMIRQRIEKKVAYQTLGKNYAAVATNNAPAINITTVNVITNRETLEVTRMPIEELKGQFGYLFKGRFPLPGKRNFDDVAVLASIQQRGYNVLIETK